MNHPIKIFIAYARLDAAYLQQLRKYLHPLERKKTIQVWYDGEIAPGEPWEQRIKDKLQSAQIILLLVSANSLYSEYFYDKEMKKALERHEKKEAIVIPIILDDCMWKYTELGDLQALPQDGIPIEDWIRSSKAYKNVAEGVLEQVKLLKAKEEELKRQKAERIAKLHPEIKKLLQNMILIEGGTFQMGTEDHDWCKPVHPVTVKDFEIAKYPITQAQWRAVMGSDPPKLKFKGCDECPVESVSWNDCQEFLQKLNELTGEKFRLPGEAEWEFAAIGGKNSKGFLYAGSSTVDEVAWYRKNADSKTHPVGKKKANELGLYDMSGNVWEWCEDDWHETYHNAPKDGTAWVETKRTAFRVLRGGSWNYLPYYCRAAYRVRDYPNIRNLNYGFRCAKTP